MSRSFNFDVRTYFLGIFFQLVLIWVIFIRSILSINLIESRSTKAVATIQLHMPKSLQHFQMKFYPQVPKAVNVSCLMHFQINFLRKPKNIQFLFKMIVVLYIHSWSMLKFFLNYKSCFNSADFRNQFSQDELHGDPINRKLKVDPIEKKFNNYFGREILLFLILFKKENCPLFYDIRFRGNQLVSLKFSSFIACHTNEHAAKKHLHVECYHANLRIFHDNFSCFSRFWDILRGSLLSESFFTYYQSFFFSIESFQMGQVQISFLQIRSYQSISTTCYGYGKMKIFIGDFFESIVVSFSNGLLFVIFDGIFSASGCWLLLKMLHSVFDF
jgi:hypothetical protein